MKNETGLRNPRKKISHALLPVSRSFVFFLEFSDSFEASQHTEIKENVFPTSTPFFTPLFLAGEESKKSEKMKSL